MDYFYTFKILIIFILLPFMLSSNVEPNVNKKIEAEIRKKFSEHKVFLNLF